MAVFRKPLLSQKFLRLSLSHIGIRHTSKKAPNPTPLLLKFPLKAKEQKQDGPAMHGDKKLKIPPHSYYTDALFGHGELDVGAENKKEYIKTHLKEYTYPVAEWNDLRRDSSTFLPGQQDDEFHDLTSSVYGPLLLNHPTDTSSFIVTDYSKGQKTNDIDQQLYGDLITPSVVHIPPRKARTTVKPSDEKKTRALSVNEVVYSANLKPGEDELIYGRRLKSVSNLKGLESIEDAVISDLEIRQAAAESTTSSDSIKQMQSISESLPPFDNRNPRGRQRPSAYDIRYSSIIKKTIPEKLKTVIPHRTSDAAKPTTFQAVQLKKEGDLKALPQAPLMNKLRPNYLDDPNKISFPGAVVMKINPEALIGQSVSPEKYPAVTTILDVTMAPESRARLDAWKARKILELGEEGFKLYQQNIFVDGRGFHTAVESVLKGADPPSVPVPERNKGHWQSLHHVFGDISNVVSVEEKINHPFLCYKGITDCVISLEGHQSLVEWKTSSTRKDTVQALYDNPLQVAAYVGAVNFDENFAQRDLQVSRGAVVVAYNSGEPASVIHFDYNLLRGFWTLWLKRLHQYWRLAAIEKSLPKRIA